MLTDVLELHRDVKSEPIIKHLAARVVDAAGHFRRPVYELDECFWAASQLYTNTGLPSHVREMNPARDFYDLKTFTAWGSDYYGSGHIFAAPARRKKEKPLNNLSLF